MSSEYGNLVIEANSKKEAEEKFGALSLDDVMDMACIIPKFMVDYEEIEKEEE